MTIGVFHSVDDFPSFSEGLSLRRRFKGILQGGGVVDFPSFSEGLSLRHYLSSVGQAPTLNFPSFSEGLSLRPGTVAGSTG